MQAHMSSYHLGSHSTDLKTGDTSSPLDENSPITGMAVGKEGVNSGCSGLSLAQCTLLKVTAFGALGGFLFGCVLKEKCLTTGRLCGDFPESGGLSLPAWNTTLRETTIYDVCMRNLASANTI